MRTRHRRRAAAKVAAAVQALEAELRARTDADLRALVETYRSRLERGASHEVLLPEVYAAVREAARRVFGVLPSEAQVLAGAALALPAVAETAADGADTDLVAALPAVWHALAGEGGVHVVTVDDGAARRSADRMTPLYRALGIDVGCLGHETAPAERRAAYLADVTYATVHEFGWDYLRDNLSWQPDECVQRGRPFAVVCDAKATLVDESGTPLLISTYHDEPDGPTVLAEITVRGYLGTYDEIAAVATSATNAEVYQRLYQLDAVSTDVGVGGARPREAVDAAAMAWRAQYDEVLEEQCRWWYAERQELVNSDEPEAQVLLLLDEAVDGCVAAHPLWDPAGRRALAAAARDLYPMSAATAELVSTSGRRWAVTERLRADVHAAYRRRADELGADALRELARYVALTAMDRAWREHLADIRRLKREIASERPGTRDLLGEYRQRADELLATAESTARADTVRLLFQVELGPDDPE